MHHGAGSSGLSFAACAGEIRKILPKAGFLSIDARSHGRTTVVPKAENSDQDSPSIAAAAQMEADGKVELDLSLETLSRDLVYVIQHTQTRMGWETMPDIVLAGHSLGGAVITDVATKGELGSKLLAYAVLDVVEGTDLPLPLNFDSIRLILYRIRHGCSPKHGEISLYPTKSLPVISVRDRVAVWSPQHFHLIIC